MKKPFTAAPVFAAAQEPDMLYDASVTAEDAAHAVGCKVVYPAENQLQLDLDTEEAFQLFLRRLGEMQLYAPEYLLAGIPAETPSKSGLPHRHITLTFTRAFTDYERIGLQLLLGSDPTREALSVLRLIGGDKQPSRLFEPAA